jgi:hypothetical protein
VSASDFDSAFGLAGTGGGAAFSTADADASEAGPEARLAPLVNTGLPKAGILKSELARKALGDVSASLVGSGGGGALKLCGPAFCIEGIPGTAIIVARPGCCLIPDPRIGDDTSVDAADQG